MLEGCGGTFAAPRSRFALCPRAPGGAAWTGWKPRWPEEDAARRVHDVRAMDSDMAAPSIVVVGLDLVHLGAVASSVAHFGVRF